MAQQQQLATATQTGHVREKDGYSASRLGRWQAEVAFPYICSLGMVGTRRGLETMPLFVQLISVRTPHCQMVIDSWRPTSASLVRVWTEAVTGPPPWRGKTSLADRRCGAGYGSERTSVYATQQAAHQSATRYRDNQARCAT